MNGNSVHTPDLDPHAGAGARRVGLSAASSADACKSARASAMR